MLFLWFTFDILLSKIYKIPSHVLSKTKNHLNSLTNQVSYSRIEEEHYKDVSPRREFFESIHPLMIDDECEFT